MEAARKFVAALMLTLIMTVACGRSEPDSGIQSARTRLAGTMVTEINQATTTPTPTQTAAPTLPPTITPTPRPTQTPSPTPTPTATAVSLSTGGDPRRPGLAEPEAQPGAPCGYVDTLDFPLDPPNAANVDRGGSDFGRFRSRYDGYHTGEDWWYSTTGRSAFGTPVYSIGHGRVTYAEPLGWNRDQGVVIVRHIFADGRTFLSFYGHLDPPSITLRPGDCVARGDQVGQIGRPRTTPHLHFEIREHMPTTPGPGYWFEDPTLAGWLPPSQTIWGARLAAEPGVAWVRPFVSAGQPPAALDDQGLLLVLDEGQVVAIDPADGRPRWRLESETEFVRVLPVPNKAVFYAAGRAGQVAAYALPAEPGAAPDLLWEVDLPAVGSPTLMLFPGGDLVLTSYGGSTALSIEGELLWTDEDLKRPLAWRTAGESLVVTTAGLDGALWTLSENGVMAWDLPLSGRLAQVGGDLLLYSGTGLYRLDPASRTAEELAELPRHYLGLGDALTLPGGDLLVTHTDLDDRRLLIFDKRGEVLWERSYASALRGQVDLQMVGDRVYLAVRSENGSVSDLALYALMLNDSEAGRTPELVRVFSGGTRASQPEESWVLPTPGGQILINIGGGHLLLLDPQVALDAVLPDLEGSFALP